jgi:hypothetical protein
MIITGEKIQQLCDIYLGANYDFNFNPLISIQTSKHLLIHEINTEYNNPYLIFCYGDQISILAQKISYFSNNFILVTHNSDCEIRNTDEIQYILKCDRLDKWYGQNIWFEHPKLHFLPIGIANSMWDHGNLNSFQNELFMQNLHIKTKKIYFNFNINTNRIKRQLCFEQLNDKGHKLVHHEWSVREQFIELCSTMDIGIQISFNETLNDSSISNDKFSLGNNIRPSN